MRLRFINTIKDWSITEVLNKLRKKRYTLKFAREASCIYCFQLREWISPEDFTVDNLYRFGDSLNPDAERMLYAISLLQGGKGFMIDTCNVYADNISQEMMQKLEFNHESGKIDLLDLAS